MKLHNTHALRNVTSTEERRQRTLGLLFSYCQRLTLGWWYTLITCHDGIYLMTGNLMWWHQFVSY